MGGGPLSRKKGLKDGTYFKGIFDWIRLEDLDTSLQKKLKLKKFIMMYLNCGLMIRLIQIKLQNIDDIRIY